MKKTNLVTIAVTAMVAWAAPAAAHIDIDLGGTHKARDSGQKAAPCGTAGSKRGTNVARYRPGATINISLVESIPHPGYFRISFDDDGDDDFVIPSGTSGEFGSCSGDPKCGPGKEDYCSNETVLLDNLEPHAAGGFNMKRTFSVTLPNIECDNCTLQIIQMMNDFNFHPSPYPADDIYYRCIDLELSNDAPVVTETPVTNNGIVCERPADPGSDPMTDPPGTEPPATGTDGGMPTTMDPAPMDPNMPTETMEPGTTGDNTMTPMSGDTGNPTTMEPGATPPGTSDPNTVAGQGGTMAPATATTPATDEGCSCTVVGAHQARDYRGLGLLGLGAVLAWRRRRAGR